ncbi:MAG: nucleotidyl transferase AbiEii/AbiGii toxin family protein [Clostridiales bacterium]|nr:nucleotidyl transferase AbiEii/AbiGii toxin family protein [Clostridiales bacterium]
MNAAIEQMLKSYQVENLYDQKNAMKEIMQEIVLCGLSRAGFFKEAAFYGGTALRIFYGLDRFSEDLDFSLMTANPEFDLAAYFPTLEKEVRSFGLNVTIQEKKKTKESNILSAFLKGNTKEHLLLFYPQEQILGGIAKNEAVKIKFEVDVNPPEYATFEHKYRLLPSPYEVNLYDMPSLFAGKVHAVLCRAWKSRIKGRDLYDYVFYLTKGASVNQKHLRERLLQSGYITPDAPCTQEDIKAMLSERFASIDYAQAKRDVEPFIRDTSALNVWCAEFFQQITEQLTVI